jgi:hypothetical protein
VNALRRTAEIEAPQAAPPLALDSVRRLATDTEPLTLNQVSDICVDRMHEKTPTSAMVVPRNAVNRAGVFEWIIRRASQVRSRSTRSGPT